MPSTGGGPMNRGGAQMPGGSGMGDTGNIMDSMYGGGGGGFGFGGGIGSRFSRSPYGNYGMGNQPQMMDANIMRLTKQCSAGDGNACNQLQIAQQMKQQEMQQWGQEQQKRAGMAQNANRSVGARSGY